MSTATPIMQANAEPGERHVRLFELIEEHGLDSAQVTSFAAEHPDDTSLRETLETARALERELSSASPAAPVRAAIGTGLWAPVLITAAMCLLPMSIMSGLLYRELRSRPTIADLEATLERRQPADSETVGKLRVEVVKLQKVGAELDAKGSAILEALSRGGSESIPSPPHSERAVVMPAPAKNLIRNAGNASNAGSGNAAGPVIRHAASIPPVPAESPGAEQRALRKDG